jgi:hypothetical protein
MIISSSSSSLPSSSSLTSVGALDEGSGVLAGGFFAALVGDMVRGSINSTLLSSSEAGCAAGFSVLSGDWIRTFLFDRGRNSSSSSLDTAGRVHVVLWTPPERVTRLDGDADSSIEAAFFVEHGFEARSFFVVA